MDQEAAVSASVQLVQMHWMAPEPTPYRVKYSDIEIIMTGLKVRSALLKAILLSYHHERSVSQTSVWEEKMISNQSGEPDKPF